MKRKEKKEKEKKTKKREMMNSKYGLTVSSALFTANPLWQVSLFP